MKLKFINRINPNFAHQKKFSNDHDHHHTVIIIIAIRTHQDDK